MPVPVPLYFKQPAHPVIKINPSAGSDPKQSVFQHLTHSLPLPPRGPPPSLATRDEWISSLPSWRRNKPRRIWEEDSCQLPALVRQGFQEGLTVADNAAVIKGASAQACIPPISTLIATADLASPSRAADMYGAFEVNMEDAMNVAPPRPHRWQCEVDAHTNGIFLSSDEEYDEMDVEVPAPSDRNYGYNEQAPRSYYDDEGFHLFPTERYERGAFTPVFEDMSPEPPCGQDPASSPIGPATPFAEYVDREVAAAQLIPSYKAGHAAEVGRGMRYAFPGECCGSQCHQCQAYSLPQIQPSLLAPGPESVVAPTASTTFKKLAEPLSEWIVSYVWKVCTTGMSLSSSHTGMSSIREYSTAPPTHLATSTHSMLLSTLLQPSAIFLALWYIVRLPVFFGPVNLDRERHGKEIRFRAELLGEAHLSFDRDVIDSYAPFRLILLGCMLANKWLDDHTFSNKTWHTISNVPIRSLNRLESLALDIFQYDLSISTPEWTDWLSHLLAYHTSLRSQTCPQPISRPSTSPHTIVRRALQMLTDASMHRPGRHYGEAEALPEPVFISIEDQKRDGPHAPHPYEDSIDALEIDLDEDGPLREEYLPKRRVSSASSLHRTHAHDKPTESDRGLPPPAKWSPEADEPLIRDNVRSAKQYVAPQPIVHMPMTQQPPLPLPFHHVMDTHCSAWSYGGYYVKPEPMFVHEPVYHAQPSYVSYDFNHPAGQSHSRSQSLSYTQAVAGQTHNRLRSYSQTRFDLGYSDVRGTESHFVPQPPPALSRWSVADTAIYPSLYDRPFDHHRTALKV
ncbi:uncharacterized protein FIBRA_01465 [Fibroporia radiculosa]|uniref:Cyclin N-terminal domain-containing protein n=1 Tax=Fibroporia radiculosa TaxID=599839 RepID=J4HTE0_9APHY|nr:uncharacterized protein FIBRA_01465 [Fibroporia radiculosa]CCL99447.1 predicted protein [Fibroporia radiculosa]